MAIRLYSQRPGQHNSEELLSGDGRFQIAVPTKQKQVISLAPNERIRGPREDRDVKAPVPWRPAKHDQPETQLRVDCPRRKAVAAR